VSHLIEHHQSWALVLLFLLIAVESAGLPLPGETALVASGVLASQGKLSIEAVIPVAAVLRITAAWMAGISHMTWWRFLLYNAAGGILWATLIGLVAYYSGQAAADAIQTYGLYAAGVIVLATVGIVLGLRWWERRMVANEE